MNNDSEATTTANAARTAANRRNAQNSTGPRDTARTRLNARKHGLLSQGITELDDPAAYRDLLNGLTVELKPVGILETQLVESVALAMLRVQRARRLEAEHIRAALHPTVTRSPFETFAPEIVDPGKPGSVSAEQMNELADGFGGATAMVVEGNYPIDCAPLYERTFKTESAACNAAKRIVEKQVPVDEVLD